MARTAKTKARTGAHAAGKAATPSNTTNETHGIACGPGTGKFVFTIRQSHVAEHYGALIRDKHVGAAKLDLVLRMIALDPEHAGARRPGFVLRDWSYGDLYDLCTREPKLRRREDRTARELAHLKRKWVLRQMDHLRELQLVKTRPRPGERAEIRVLRDDGSRKAFDKPVGKKRADRFLTINGSLIATGTMAGWGAPEVAAYLAALLAEQYDPRGADQQRPSPGTGRWWRSLAWFGNPDYQPKERTILPFSPSLLEEGFARLRDAGFITWSKTEIDPFTNRKLPATRNWYHNKFARLDRKVEVRDAPDPPRPERRPAPRAVRARRV